MSQINNAPRPPLKPVNEGSIPRSSLNIPMPAGAKPPPSSSEPPGGQDSIVDLLGLPPGVEDVDLEISPSRELPRAADFS